MKSAEELADEVFEGNNKIYLSINRENFVKLIKSRDIEVYKAGMSEAANLRTIIGHNHANDLREAILSARDAKQTI